MRPNSWVRFLALLAVAAAGLGQSESEPYFSLSSSRTFGSHGRPIVQLTATNVDALDFRVYRINDPVEVFQQLEDPHQFGGHAPRPPHEVSFLELIHDWKSRLRTTIRHSVRDQFTESPTAHFESLLHPSKTAAGQAHYPESPVLNPQQLVLSFSHPVQSHRRWNGESVSLDLKERGVYLVEAVNQDLRAYTIVMVSDLVLTTKNSDGHIAAFVADRNTGEPVAGAQIWTVTRNERLAPVETGADGMAEIPAPKVRSDDLRIVARRDADTSVNVINTSEASDAWEGYVYTDRPVYRPGHTVHFKAILRLRTLTGYDVPAARNVSVEIQDPEQKPIYRKSLTTSANGTLHDELTLPPAAALGNYYIALRAGAEANMGGSFEVEEYKKPEYEVRVTPAKLRVLEGDSAQVTIDARYYFGEPVSGAKVKYDVYRSRYWFPLWYDADEESDGPAEADTDADSDEGGDQILDEEGKLDQEGRLTITFPTTLSSHKFDYRYRVEAHVTDDALREITGRGSVIATYGSFVVNVTPERYFYQPGTTAAFTVEARDYDNNPMQTRLHVELLPWEAHDKTYGPAKGATDADTGTDGSAKAQLLIPAAGAYRMRVTARTPEGRVVEDDASIWTPGGSLGGYFGESARKGLQIVTDKKTYRPGDTAQLLLMTGKPNTPVYITVEGRGLRSRQLLRSPDSTAVFAVPVTVADEPGFFVSAQFLRAGSMYRGSKYVKVPPVDHQLNVSVATDKPQYQPGQTAQYSINVTNAEGKPAPQAEFSLGVVDEAIYAIRPDTVQDPLGFFFGHEWNHVLSEDSLDYYFNGEAGKRRMQLAQLRPPSRLAQLKPERLAQPKVRKAFPDTAFWAADLTTDAAGRAQTKVDFPDSLTTWRATARGVTHDTRVGAATLKTTVRKNLILRLAVPRFFVQGDEVVVSALVHNYLTGPKKARVSLELKGLDVLDGATREVEVLSRSEVRIDWRVRAQQVRSATILGKALTDEESDAVELEIRVDPVVKTIFRRQ
jgi:hypothetical protein